MTRTEYACDELGRLDTAKVTWRNRTELTTPEETRYGYNEVGSRKSVTLPNNVYTEYRYNALNRLSDLTHYKDSSKALSISSFIYEVYANGMRSKASESLRYPSGQADQNPVTTYGYDALNRVTSESADSSYDVSYSYDLVGNRTQRAVTARNAGGAPLTTTYTYDTDHPDRLQTESYSGPFAAIPWRGDRVYAYADGSSHVRYWLPDRQRYAGQLRALFMGLPSAWTGRLLTAVLAILPLAFFWPVIVSVLRRFRSVTNGPKPTLSLYHRCLCVLFTYVFLIGPDCLQTLAHGAVEYSQISTLAWGKGGQTITYGYDDNGSVTSKVTTEGGNPVESVAYVYNRQDRLASVAADNHDGEIDHAEYRYNSSGIRVSAHTWTTVNGVPEDEETVLYLVDLDNHTGYAQVFEETTYAGADPDPATNTPTKRITYTIGDDVIAQAVAGDFGSGWEVNDTEYLLYDGHGSTRNLIAHNYATDAQGKPYVHDSYSYDGYGVMLSTGSGAEVAANAATTLLYTGEQYDRNLSQYYLRARYYDASTARFSTTDPYAGSPQDPQSLHKYLYCHANPVNAIDPAGMEYTYVSTLTVSAIIGELAAICLPHITAALLAITTAALLCMIYDLSREYISAGLTAAAAMIMSNAQAVVKAIKDVAKALGRTVKQLQKFKLFPVIKAP